MEQVIAEFKYAKLYYNAEMKLAKIVWNGTPDTLEYKMPFKTLLKHAETHPIDNFLSDITHQGIISIENRKWFENQVVPEAKAAGLKRSAIVTSDNPFKRHYISMVLLVVNTFNMPVKVFSNHAQAEKWLHDAELEGVTS